MALTGWTKKCQITIAASKLPYTHANQVVMLYTTHFPTGMVTLGGSNACKSDGSDIRFSTDANGDTLIPFDIININLNATPANSVLVVAFKTSVTANATFSVYCHWGNASASRLAASDTYGAANCWSEIYGILYLQEDPANASTATQQWKFFKEATGRYSAASEIGSLQKVTGPVTGMSAIAINATNGIRIPEVISTQASDTFTVAAIVRPAGTTYPGSVPTADYSGALFFSGASEMLIGWSTSGECKWQYAGGYANPQFGIGKGNSWKVWVTQVSGTSALYYLDPTAASFSVGSITALTNLQYLGGADTGGTVKAGAYHICMFMIGKFALPNMDWFRNIQKNIDNIATLATPGSITSTSVSATLTLTGLADGTEVRVYNGATEVAGVESSSGGTFTYNYSSAFTATIVIHNVLDQYIRYTSLSLTTSGATIPIQQIDDLWYVGSIPSNVNATNVTVNSTNNTIAILNSTSIKLQNLYSYLKTLWKSDATLIAKPFPLTPITDESFILNDPWNFADTATINLLRGAGYSRRNASNAVLEEYCNITTLGSVTGTPYYTQTTSATETATNNSSSGAINNALKIYGDASNGNFDYRSTAFKVYSRVLGRVFASYDLFTEQSVSTLTYKKYAVPLTNPVDSNATITSTATLSAAPYSNIQLSEYNYDGAAVVAWAAATAYTLNKVLSVGWGSVITWSASLAITQGQRIALSGTVKGSWVTATAYAIGDIVYAVDPTATGSDAVTRYYCYSAHTSGTFATDITTKWVKYSEQYVCTTAHTSSAALATDIGNINKWAPASAWVRCTSAHTSAASIYTDLISGKIVSYEGARYINGGWSLFTKVIDGAGLTLNQIYCAHQYRLTLASDVIAGSKTKNGNILPIMLSYVGNTLVTANGVFIENFAAADINKVDFYDYLGVKVNYPTTVTFTLTGLQANSEVRIYKNSDSSELTGIENSTTSFAYQYTYTADVAATVVIHNINYEYLSIPITLGSTNTSLPVQQRLDRNYLNP